MPAGPTNRYVLPSLPRRTAARNRSATSSCPTRPCHMESRESRIESQRSAIVLVRQSEWKLRGAVREFRMRIDRSSFISHAKALRRKGSNSKPGSIFHPVGNTTESIFDVNNQFGNFILRHGFHTSWSL